MATNSIMTKSRRAENATELWQCIAYSFCCILIYEKKKQLTRNYQVPAPGNDRHTYSLGAKTAPRILQCYCPSTLA